MLVVRVPGLVRVVAVMRRFWRRRKRSGFDAVSAASAASLSLTTANATVPPSIYHPQWEVEWRFDRAAQARRIKNERAKHRRRANRLLDRAIDDVLLGFSGGHLVEIKITFADGGSETITSEDGMRFEMGR